jgi:hypothetical protein
VLSTRNSMFATVVRRALTMTIAFVVPFLILGGMARAGALEMVIDNGVRAAPAVPSKLDRLMSERDCSSTGLAKGVVPKHSIVRENGAVRLTSFAEGWEMYAGHRPGTLVAVCRG